MRGAEPPGLADDSLAREAAPVVAFDVALDEPPIEWGG